MTIALNMDGREMKSRVTVPDSLKNDPNLSIWKIADYEYLRFALIDNEFDKHLSADYNLDNESNL